MLSIYKCLTQSKAKHYHAAFLESSLYQEYVVRRLAEPRMPFVESTKDRLQAPPSAVQEEAKSEVSIRTDTEDAVDVETPEQILERLKRERKNQ